MSLHLAEVTWQFRDGDDFLAGRYSRLHQIRFDGGATIEGSPALVNVPAPWSDEAGVDPEEMFVAALSACHMLWFLDFARRSKVTVHAYRDHAEGAMARNAEGRTAFTRVTLRPHVDCDAGAHVLGDLHHKAHEACFIANSVACDVLVEPDYKH